MAIVSEKEMMCNDKKNGAALADARFFQLLHLQSESVTAVKVNTGKGVEKSGESRSVGRNYRPSPGEDPHGAAENRISAFAHSRTAVNGHQAQPVVF